MAAQQTYGLRPEFEAAITHLACSSQRFYARIGTTVDPELLASKVAKLIWSAAHSVYAATGAGPATPVIALQRLRSWEEDGRITASEVDSAKEYLLDAYEQALGLSEDQVVAELTAPIQQRLRRAAIDQALQDYAKKAPMQRALDALSKAESVGRVEASVELGLDGAAKDSLVRLGGLGSLATGIHDLDMALLGGAKRATYNVVLGSTGDGKSMFLGHVAASAAALGAFSVYITLELPPEYVVARILGNLTDIPVTSIIEDPFLRNEAFDRRLPELRDKHGLGVFRVTYMTPRAATVADVARFVREVQDRAKSKVDLVVVDYAVLLAEPTQRVRHEEQTAIAEKLRAFAAEDDVVLWTAAQATGEGMDKKKTKVLDAHHVADSKGIAKTADLIVSVNRRDDGDTVLFRVAKNRYGAGDKEIGPYPHDFERGRIAPTVWPWMTREDTDV